jgi:16S rRNA (guanine966-N2)-methyltransferase
LARRQQRPQQVRILGGSLRGRAIDAPPGLDVRPTAARTREALFNLLLHGGHGPDGGNILAGAHIADLCCGTGALAFEALSRGAATAVLVDKDHHTLRLAEQNATKLGIAGQCRFVQAALPDGMPPGPFDLVFSDPPYGAGLSQPIAAALRGRPALSAHGLLCLELPSAEPLGDFDGYERIDLRQYGAASILLLRPEAPVL